MKEKLSKIWNDIKKNEKISKAWESIKKNKQIVAIVLYCAVVLAAILSGILGMRQPVVAVCMVLILEVAIAALMHNVEIWIHAVVLLIEILAAILIARVPLMILCALVYVATILALRVLYKGKDIKYGQ